MDVIDALAPFNLQQPHQAYIHTNVAPAREDNITWIYNRGNRPRSSIPPSMDNELLPDNNRYKGYQSIATSECSFLRLDSSRLVVMDNSSLHEAIISSFLTSQRPPTVREIATRFQCSEATARQGLQALGDYHGVVLHPHSDEVWVAHPFSAAPTTCIVSSGERKWWGNCAWCSLGVMHLAGGTATLNTRLGAIGDEVTLTVQDGKLLDKDYVIHFPVPMRNAWDNVIYTCSVQLLFRNEAEVDEWCSTRGIPKGDVRPVEQIWDFAKEWYGRHADADWTKWSLNDAVEIFHRHNLGGPTWTIGGDTGRF